LRLEEVVGVYDVLIAVIGSRWLTSSDRGGRRRLDIPEDIVRLEIATALKRGIRVVPVLVDGATMPEVGELPDDLKALVRRNAVEIGHNRFRRNLPRRLAFSDPMNSIQERSEPLLQPLDPAQMPASTLRGQAWIPLIGSPGNMQVLGSKGREQLAVEVAEATVAGLSSLFFGR